MIGRGLTLEAARLDWTTSSFLNNKICGPRTAMSTPACRPPWLSETMSWWWQTLEWQHIQPDGLPKEEAIWLDRDEFRRRSSHSPCHHWLATGTRLGYRCSWTLADLGRRNSWWSQTAFPGKTAQEADRYLLAEDEVVSGQEETCKEDPGIARRLSDHQHDDFDMESMEGWNDFTTCSQTTLVARRNHGNGQSSESHDLQDCGIRTSQIHQAGQGWLYWPSGTPSRLYQRLGHLSSIEAFEDWRLFHKHWKTKRTSKKMEIRTKNQKTLKKNKNLDQKPKTSKKTKIWTKNQKKTSRKPKKQYFRTLQIYSPIQEFWDIGFFVFLVFLVFSMFFGFWSKFLFFSMFFWFLVQIFVFSRFFLFLVRIFVFFICFGFCSKFLFFSRSLGFLFLNYFEIV